MINDIHQPVMSAEVIEHLVVSVLGVYLDATCGCVRHTELIHKELNFFCNYIERDQYQDAVNFFMETFTDQNNLK